MKIKYYTVDAPRKSSLLKLIEEFFSTDSNVLFVYVHGSFIKDSSFRDIDVAIYLIDMNLAFKYTVEKSTELEIKLGYPVDIHVLNEAPLAFRYNVLREGFLVLLRDYKVFNAFLESTLKGYWDFKEFLENNLKIKL